SITHSCLSHLNTFTLSMFTCTILLSLFSLLLFYLARHHRYLPSFPTRRSSDLWRRAHLPKVSTAPSERITSTRLREPGCPPSRGDRKSTRQLQSPDHLVCRLLLEKKKKKRN